MSKKSPVSIQENLTKFKKLSESFEPSTNNFEKLYNETIKTIAESPYMFNYYHWITDFRDLSIVHIAGVKKMLGHDEHDFDIKKSIAIIHPNFQPFVLEYARNAYEMLTDPRYRFLSNKSHYSIQFPVQKTDGTFLLVQMNISIIMVDNVGNPLMNYNRFEVLGPYFDEPVFIKPRVSFRTEIDLSEKAEQAEQELSDKVKAYLINQLNFTETENAVLICLSNDATFDDIAKKFNISTTTVKKHTVHILKKAREKLFSSFESARHVALYLKKMSII